MNSNIEKTYRVLYKRDVLGKKREILISESRDMRWFPPFHKYDDLFNKPTKTTQK